jgi:hypothetical protein
MKPIWPGVLAEFLGVESVKQGNACFLSEH